MAERRMFAKKIIDSDDFLDMPLSTQALYFHLCMRADDDGFTASAKRIVKTIDAKDDDLKLLFAKNFIIPFETGIVVIKHWKIHNYIAKDRYRETMYVEEKSQLEVENNSVYTLYTECNTPCIPSIGKVSIGKESIDKVILDEKKTTTKFIKPTLEQLQEYIAENNYTINAEYFIDYYESKGWVVGKSKMKDWKATVRNWARNEKPKNVTVSKPMEREIKEDYFL